MPWLDRLVTGAAAGAMGALLALLWGGDGGDRPAAVAMPGADPALIARLDALEVRLDAVLARNALAESPRDAGTRPAAPVAVARDPDDAGPQGEPSLAAVAPDETDLETNGEPQETSRSARPPAAEALREAGVAPDLAARIEQRVAEVEMERLYLRDRATREGWIGSEEFQAALREQESPSEAVRREFGDDLYDRYLYATGSRNRVVIANTLLDSPAAAAGILPGDQVLSYADQRVFNIRDLQAATSAGRAGDSVVVELLRDGVVVYATVPRGPLGVRLDLERHAPPSSG